LLALDFRFVEATSQHEKFVAADGGFGAKISNCFRRGLLDRRKTLFEAERIHPLVIRVKLVEVDDVRILFVSLDALDDLVFDIIHRLCVGRWPIFRASLTPERGQSKFVRDAVNVQIEKDGGCRAIVVGGLT
jgi:hypothetical protein